VHHAGKSLYPLSEVYSLKLIQKKTSRYLIIGGTFLITMGHCCRGRSW